MSLSMKNLPKNRLLLLSGIIVLSTVFLFLRIRTLGHLLMWDEAWNVLSLRAYLAKAAQDPFYWYYSFHPPLYMFFASLLSPFKAGFGVRAETLSLLFSYGSFLAAIGISFRLGGRRYALLTGFFLCLLPLSLGYDTWIKRDSLAVFLGYSSLLLALYNRPFPGAFTLGLSLLSKESGLFFVPAFFFTVLMGPGNGKRFFTAGLSAVIITAVSAWWYIGFSNLSGRIADFYFNSSIYGSAWAEPFHYYASKLLYDAGIPALIFFASGLCSLLYFSRAKGRYDLLIPLIVFFSVFLPASFAFSTKTPWLSYSLGPAIAMIAASGAHFALGRSYGNRFLRGGVFVVLFLAAVQGVSFNYTSYLKNTCPKGWPGAKVSRDLAMYLNSRMRPEDKLMLSDFAYWNMPVCPVFFYYWDKHPVIMFSGKESAEDILLKAKENNVTWLAVASSPDPSHNYDPLIAELSSLLGRRPEQAGWTFVWNL